MVACDSTKPDPAQFCHVDQQARGPGVCGLRRDEADLPSASRNQAPYLTLEVCYGWDVQGSPLAVPSGSERPRSSGRLLLWRYRCPRIGQGDLILNV